MNLDLNCSNAYLSETVRAINDLDQNKLREIADQLGNIQDNEGILWVAGNGGSASTGAHLACDVGKGIASATGTPIRTLSLNEQMVTHSAWANDFGFEYALMNQLRYLARPQDGLLVISGSGNSENLVNVARWAQEHSMHVTSLLGANGGRISDYTTLELRISSTDQQVIENIHLVVVHWLFKVMAHAI
jgi:D-sedoheptulose 7-phosphate isomerase